MRMFRLFPLVAVAVCLNGCLGLRPDTSGMSGGVSSYDGISEAYPGDAQVMADLTAQELARRYPPGRTSLAPVYAPGVFAQALDAELRAWGFTVLPAGQASPGPNEADSGVRVGYVLDAVRGEASPTAYLQARASDGERFGFVHALGSGVVPAMPEQATLAYAPVLSPAAPAVAQLSASGAASGFASGVAADPYLSPPTPEVAGFGNQNTPLHQAALSRLPSGWQCTIPDPEKRSVRVNWREQSAWRDALHVMAEQAGCTAVFDEKARRVTIAATLKSGEQLSTQSAMNDSSQYTLQPSMQQAVQPYPQILLSGLEPGASVPVPAGGGTANGDARGEWKLTPGSLHNQLMVWTDRAGYQLVWNAAEDLDMESHATFRGLSFLEAIRKLSDGLIAAGHPLRVTVYQGNTVVEIADN